MSTIVSHAAVPIALSACFPEGILSREAVLCGVVCSMIPDLDVIGFAFGVRYDDPWGHRGMTHSIFFAVCLGALLTAVLPYTGKSWPLFLFLFLSTASHPLIDALTDGGLGVALFAPFSKRRYFFAWRPLAVPPIGILAFFSAYGWHVLKSEMRWIWLPCGLVFGIAHALREL
ncbi:metal-dependent hydrolase [Methylocaldum szegediense]|uniref:Inner membrane protein n=1 Tax=Methylocaldum szegediense TaxID=73780 RepID=A0ABM9I6V2_9GAMM|nr:metal-dependent hydrolase [Methylocaldum szegediense]CAI8930922.1 inner membrane protein [Methylocaldum szegediense]